MTDHSNYASDRHRPIYHFLPPSNWMNDPNGLIHWKGNYHLFYQHNPNGAFWGTMHWGHAISKDLVHWKHMPIALRPERNGPDADGVFSGSAVDVNGVATLLYTAVRGTDQLPCIATSHDEDLATWTKHPGNPVIEHPPQDLNTTIFRDHSVWTEEGHWYQVIGSGIDGEGGTALIYRSSNFIDWEFVGSLVDSEWRQTGIGEEATGWECPDFFEIDGRHVLIVSMWDHRPLLVGYYVGTYKDHKFIPQSQGIVDPGQSFYAPQSFYDAEGRRVMFGWIKESRTEDAQRAAGWSGVMTLPRLLYILDDGSLGTAPVPEIVRLRGKHEHITGEQLTSAASIPMSGISGESLELLVTLSADASVPVSIDVLCTDDGEETTTITFDPREKSLGLDTRKSSRSDDVMGEFVSLEHQGLSSGSIGLRIFIDHSVVEVFLNDEKCITGRAYPTRSDATAVKVSAANERLPIEAIDAWNMKPSVVDG